MTTVEAFTFYDAAAAAELDDVRAELIATMRARWRWDDVSCLFCEDTASSHVVSNKHGIAVRQCDDCEHVFVSPRLQPEAVPDLYSQSYWDTYQRSIGSPSLADRIVYDYKNGFGKLSRDVLPYRDRGKLLDIGASNGGMVRAAREAGFSANGIEPSREIAEMAKSAHGIDLMCGNLLELGLPKASWDIITMHDVLEHLFEPLEMLRECSRISTPTGLLVIETPTISSLECRRDGDGWDHMSPLEHVHLFNEKNLARAVEQSGFDIVDLYCPHENNVIVIAESR